MSPRLTNALRAILHHVTPIRLIVAAVVVVFFWFFILGDQGINRLRRLLEMKNQLTSERRELNDDIDRLAREKEMLSDPKNLEPVIRSELGYIRPGEILFEERE